MDSSQKVLEYTETTRDICVTVVPEFSEERSEPAQDVFVYSYTVSIENRGSEAAQLINRHWEVMSEEQKIADVKGEGVVGEQPLLEPGVVFQYTSWTVVNSPVGSMVGCYTFCSENGEFFDVKIPRFELVYMTDMVVH